MQKIALLLCAQVMIGIAVTKGWPLGG